jgi:hypothetical protein
MTNDVAERLQAIRSRLAESDFGVWHSEQSLLDVKWLLDHLTAQAKITAGLRTATSLHSEGWDGYGAAPISEAALNAADELYSRVHAVPLVDGGVQLEVHSTGWDIEIEIAADGTPQGALIGKLGEDVMTTYAAWPIDAKLTAQAQELETLRTQHDHTWVCGCGWRNGCNLALCARCTRTPDNLSVQDDDCIHAAKVKAQAQKIAKLQSQYDRARVVWESLAIRVSCTSPDGSAELEQVSYLRERCDVLEGALRQAAQENHEKSYYWLDDRHEISAPFDTCPVEECRQRLNVLTGERPDPA